MHNLHKFLVSVTELHFDTMLYSTLDNENYDAGHVKCSCGLHLAPATQVPHPVLQHRATGCFTSLETSKAKKR